MFVCLFVCVCVCVFVQCMCMCEIGKSVSVGEIYSVCVDFVIGDLAMCLCC